MNREVPLEDIERAVADIAAGRPVVVIDDERRENEGDIVFAAEMASAELMAFTIRYSSGVICVPMAGEVLDRLAIGPMVAVNQDPMRTAFAVSVDAAVGVSTGISAADRAHTTRALAAADSVASDFVRPGHVFPLRARPGGVLARRRLDTLKLIADKMYDEFKEPLYAAPPLLLRMVEAGQLGKKSGRGFYTY